MTKPFKTAYFKNDDNGNIGVVDIFDNGNSWVMMSVIIDIFMYTFKNRHVVDKSENWVQEYLDYEEKGLKKEFNALLKEVRGKK